MWILDRNTISYYFRGDAQVVPRLQALRPSEVGVPAIVVYELRYGLMRLPQQIAMPRLLALNQLLRPMRVLAFDDECATHAAHIRTQCP
jgi:tRNA(fMet)-specific endonuclease VapC